MSGGVSFLLKAIYRPGESDRRQLSSLSNAVINANGVLCVNSLDAEQVELSQMFARSRQGADERAVQRSTLERPYHRFAVLHPIARALDCGVSEVREVGSHTVFFAEVLSTVHVTNDQPLIHRRRGYATIPHVG
jgi:flavin reductase (DIM6/NTAB) family NADH-FMN oxidoreductase RutF